LPYLVDKKRWQRKYNTKIREQHIYVCTKDCTQRQHAILDYTWHTHSQSVRTDREAHTRIDFRLLFPLFRQRTFVKT